MSVACTAVTDMPGFYTYRNPIRGKAAESGELLKSYMHQILL